jgi:hypothetical protein
VPEALTLQIVKSASSLAGGPVVFAMVRDEDYLLPFFFAHYRALGVGGFVIYDDRSAAATLELLSSQPDCVIVRSPHQFGDSFGVNPEGTPRRLGQVLKMSAPETLLAGRWVLTVDADEFLILPPGVADLAQLIARLEALGQVYLTAPMVEFYGETLAHRNYPLTLDPFEAQPFFDVGPYYDWSGGIVPSRLVGGVRERLMRRLAERAPDAFAEVYLGHPPYPVKTWKAPLLKHGCGVTRVNNHELSVVPRTEIAGALAHFKFGPDLDAKIERAVREGQYYNRSMEYRFLEAAVRWLGDETLVGGETRRFEGPQSLVDAGLLPRLDR